MQLWARRLSLRQKNLVHILTLSPGRAQSSQGWHPLRGLHRGIAVSTNKQTPGRGIYKRADQQQEKDGGGQAVVAQPNLDAASTLSTNRVVWHNLDTAKPQVEEEKMLPPKPMNNPPPSLQELEWQSGAGQDIPSMATPLNPIIPNHSGATLITTHSDQWVSLVAQARLSSNQTNTITLQNNTMPTQLPEGDWSPKSGRLRPRAPTKALPTQRQGVPLKAPTGPSKKARSHNREGGRDPVTPPSAESGGIPEPTQAYLLRASFLPQTLASPRPMLVIIDLNGTLLHRPSKKDPSRFTERPHARAFLTYCIDTFHVVIWSSARERNVSAMCDSLLTPAQRDRVLAIWSRAHFGLSPADYSNRVQCYKRLTRVWGAEAIASTHPHGAAWDQGNTVLIDDSSEKARSEPFNAIQIPEFLGGEGERSAVLPQVHDYLNTLACQQDISMYIRAHPFKAEGVLPAGSVM